MLTFVLLMLVPTAIAVFSVLHFKGKVTLGEFAVQVAVPAVLIIAGLAACYYVNTTDYEVWNGRVTAKESKRVSCSHSYRCHCVTTCTGSGKHRSCSESCQTCYEHSYDVSWYVYASTGEHLTIHRVDRQGLDMPPRWGAVFVGEPFASQHQYTNYLLANRSSVLFGGRGDVEQFKALIPENPVQVYDYYRVAHVINMGVPNVDVRTWQWLVEQINGDLGPKKQVNVNVLFVKTADPRYTLALRNAWAGGKKNGATVVIGSLDGHKIEFAEVVSWSPAQSYKVTLRDRIQQIGTLDQRDAITTAIREETATKYARMHMKNYEYLMRTIEPSSTAVLVLFVLSVLISVGLAIYLINNDVSDVRLYGKRYQLKPRAEWRNGPVGHIHFPRSFK